MGIKRVVIDNSIEKRILTGLIVSAPFCKEVCPILSPSYFLVDHIKTVVKWVQTYYLEYKEAPGKHIQNLFEEHRGALSDAEDALVFEFLTNLSQEYEDEAEFNTSYLVDKTLTYFRHRGLSVVAEKIKTHISCGKLDLAEAQIQRYKQIAKDTTTWINPIGDFAYIERAFDSLSEPLFCLPGAFSRLTRGFQKDWLVGFLGPMKRGKSWWLLEMATQAMLHRLKTVFISLEMPGNSVAMRFYKRLTALDERNEAIVLPCFDCMKNQDGICRKNERTGVGKLLGSDGFLPKFDEAIKHRVCTYCKDNNSAEFVPSVWYTHEARKRLSPASLTKQVLAMKRMQLDKYLRIKAYPSYSANLSDLRHGLASLEYTEGFIPDVIVIDYADILAPENSNNDRRAQVDETWKMLKNMAATRHCLVVTASQSTRDSIKKKSVSQIDTAEDIRKLAHADLVFSLNQTKEEKKQKLMRVGIIAEREDEYNEDDQVMVLQQLNLGQTCLDTYYVSGYK